MKQVVIGVFDNATEAQTAVQHLMNEGFEDENEDISNQVGSGSDLTDRDSQQDNGFGDKVNTFFKSVFGDSNEAGNYSEVARRSSGSLVTVYVDSSDEAEQAASILDECGAIDVDERASQYRNSNTTDTFTSANTFTDTSNKNITSDTSIPIIEEELEVGKREINTGGMKVHSRIVERPVEETLRLRVEHVNVERNKVDRPATEGDLSNFKDGTIEVKEYAETPVIKKEARVVEEIRLNKEVEEKEETVRETVRKTDVNIENNPPDNQTRNSNRGLTDREGIL